ncbi:hypothetical protein P280DRAFT_401783 [Massarina eburnea CBS 473.64]|uniref:Myb-like domain-containing protein n=1 Tax=Massarina eburnea CBS 473.64 TaxID=1395130 RepID=A0A6A6RVQ4_9PLEO|nr:hypothetical protein P280DRAFT_401783 [Massarina eburnea CBS 473.64]
MSDSDSEFNASDSSHAPSSEEDQEPERQRVATTPRSPRKRRRSGSDSSDLVPARKYHLEGKYNDAYRALFNEDVYAAATRFVVDESLNPEDAQIGGSSWSSTEKTLFFAALERLGKDDLPGISKAIETKSMQETRQFILLLQEAPSKRDAMRGVSKTKVTLQDIPAAVEIDRECETELELTGEALAWFQERYEMKQEQAQYGDYWLITPELAEQLDEAMKSQLQSSASSPVTTDAEEEGRVKIEKAEAPSPQILQDIPEAELLNPTKFLYLSQQFFMNPHPHLPYPWPHWTELVSECAREPSIYRTAFTNFHTLAVSLTRRIVQAAIVQATSRLRSQDWRVKKGSKPYVHPKDIFTAVDILGLKRNGHQRWAGVARRCGLRVKDRDRRKQGDGQRRDVSWDEAEKLLGAVEIPEVPVSSDDGHTSGTDNMRFKAKAMRSGTPLPTSLLASSDEEVEPTHNAHEEELEATEAFDQAASQQAQRGLWDMLGTSTTAKRGFSNPREEIQEPEIKTSRNKVTLASDDWRKWTQYHAEWEEHRHPIPPSRFLANKRAALSQAIEDTDTDSNGETLQSSNVDEARRKRRKPSKIDIPIRSTRAYAAMQDTGSFPADRNVQSEFSEEEADIPTQSIE